MWVERAGRGRAGISNRVASKCLTEVNLSCNVHARGRKVRTGCGTRGSIVRFWQEKGVEYWAYLLEDLVEDSVVARRGQSG